jgi:hypothetical protein
MDFDDVIKYKQIRSLGYQKGFSYEKRVKEVNAIYDKYVKTGLSNKFIWRMKIYPIYGISERTFYNYLKKGG